MSRRRIIILSVVVITVLALAIIVGGFIATYYLVDGAVDDSARLSYSAGAPLDDETFLVFSHDARAGAVAVELFELGQGSQRSRWSARLPGLLLGQQLVLASEEHIAIPLQNPTRIAILERNTGELRAEIAPQGQLATLVRLTDDELIFDDGRTRSTDLDGHERWSLAHGGNCVHDYFDTGEQLAMNGCRGVVIDPRTGNVTRELPFERHDTGTWPLAVLAEPPPRLLMRSGSDFLVQALAPEVPPEMLTAAPLGAETPMGRTTLLGRRSETYVLLSEAGGGQVSVEDGRSTDAPAPLWLYGLDLESRSLRWRLDLGPWRSEPTPERVFSRAPDLPQVTGVIARKSDGGQLVLQLSMVNISTGERVWATPELRNDDVLNIHRGADSTIVELRSLDPNELLIGVYAGDSGELVAARRFPEGRELRTPSILDDRLLITQRDRWFLLSLPQLEVLASQNIDDESPPAPADGADQLRRQLGL